MGNLDTFNGVFEQYGIFMKDDDCTLPGINLHSLEILEPVWQFVQRVEAGETIWSPADEEKIKKLDKLFLSRLVEYYDGELVTYSEVVSQLLRRTTQIRAGLHEILKLIGGASPPPTAPSPADPVQP